MAGLQIRWRSVGRAAAIGVAVIAGIISLPALLGSDRPPPVPPDVGLTAPPANVGTPAAPAPPNPAPKANPDGSGKFVRPTRKNSPRRRSSDRRKHRRAHPSTPRSYARPQHSDQASMAPSVPVPAPQVYSYVPPPTPGEFQFER